MKLHYSSTFGFENIYPSLLKNRGEAIAGELYLGKKGLLEFLELHLGLPYRDVNDLLRVKVYETAIRKALEAHPEIYCKASFQTDAWNTAQQLLLWRDDLILTLWDFQCPSSDISDRLYALATIEQYLENLPKGINDRWKLVFQKCATHTRFLPLKELLIYEQEDFYHPFFKKLFKLFESNGIAVHHRKMNWPKSKEITDLAYFKQKLIDPEGHPQRKSKPDGTIEFISSQNDLVLADIIAAQSERGDLMIIPSRGVVLENAIIRQGHPALGYTEPYSDSAILNILKMVTLFLWEPLDSEKLLEFLTAREAPISLKLRQKLANAYSSKPGFENEAWREVLTNNPEFQKDYQLWFHRNRFPVTGAPASEVIRIYQDLLEWTRQRQAGFRFNPLDGRRLPFEELEKQTELLLRLCKQEKVITPIMLSRWIKEMLNGNSFYRLHAQEIGAQPYVNHPGNINAAVDHLTWWNFTEEGNPLSSAFLPSPAENEHLKGCAVHQAEQILDQWYYNQIKGILFTEKKLTLCIPEKIGGEEIAPHPLLADLKATFENWEDFEKKDYTYVKRTPKGLPRASDYVRFTWPEGVEKERESAESFSSISKMLSYPYEYFLEYILNIRPIEPPQLTIDARLKGTLIHQVAENLYSTMDTSKIREELENVIRSEGEVFNLPKYQLAKTQFIQMGEQSLKYLFEQIRNNRWEFVEAEEKHEKDGFTGYIDLVLQRGSEKAVIDLKFGSFTSRKEEMRKGNEMQLMMYYHLLGGTDYLGYYILSKNRFLMHNTAAIHDALPMNRDVNLHDHYRNYWQNFTEGIACRKNQIARGLLEEGTGMNIDVLTEDDFWNSAASWMKIPFSQKIKEAKSYGRYQTLLGK